MGALPAHPAPAGFRSLDDTEGSGRALLGAVAGESASAGLRQTLRLLRTYFGSAPVVSAAVGDPDDTRVLAFFDATLVNVGVRGAVMVDTTERGADVQVVFDHTATIAQTFSRMGKQLSASQRPPGAGPSGSLPSAPVELAMHASPDGTARVGLPAGWRITGWGNGAVDVSGPAGEEVHLGSYMPILKSTGFGAPAPGVVYLPFIPNPAQATQAINDFQAQQGADLSDFQVLEAVQAPPPTGAGQAAFVFASSVMHGRPYYHYALVNSADMSDLGWTFYFSSIAAPQSSFGRQFSAMLQIWRSWSLNPQVISDRLADAVTKMRQASQIVREASRSQSDAFERSNKGWDYYLTEREVIERSGTHWTMDRDLASAIVQDDPVNHRYVPPSQYRPDD